jgi:hypothetical protein
MSQMDKIVAMLHKMQRDIRDLQVAPQLGNSSLEGGINNYDPNTGTLVGRIGDQFDGSYGYGHFSGPKPPQPTAPIVTPCPGGLTITWDGGFTPDPETGEPRYVPMDFTRVEVHIGDEPGFYDQSALHLRGTIETPRGGDCVVVPLAIETKYVVLVTRTSSGGFSDPSAEVSGTPGSWVTDAEVAAIQADIATANAELDAAEITLQQNVTALGLLQVDVTANKVLLDQARADIVTGTGLINGLRTDLTANQAAVATAHNDIVANTGLINGLRTDLTANQAAVATAHNDIVANTGLINGLRTDLTANQTATAAAQTTANGKGRVYFQTAAPGGVLTVFDLWFDTDDDNRPYKWDGTAWVAQPLGNAAIANLDAGKISTGFLAAARIQVGSLSGDKITVNTLNGDRVVANSLNADRIVAASITGDRIAAATINGDRIIAGSIAGDRITANSVNADRIVAGSITGDRIAAATINGDRIVAASINGDRIVANSVNADRIVANSITGDRIAAATINGDRLIANTVNADRIVANSIGGDKIAANAIVAGHIAAEQIYGGHLVGLTITGDKIAANAITAVKIAAREIGADKIAVGAITADELAANSVTASELDAYAVTAKTITGGTFRTGYPGDDRIEIIDQVAWDPYLLVNRSIRDTIRWVRGSDGALAGEIRGYMGDIGAYGLHLNSHLELGNVNSTIYQVGRRSVNNTKTQVRMGSATAICDGAGGWTASIPALPNTPTVVVATLGQFSGTFMYMGFCVDSWTINTVGGKVTYLNNNTSGIVHPGNGTQFAIRYYAECAV